MSALNWGAIQDGGTFESLMHAILYAEDPDTILFGRPGKDAGQDARNQDGTIIYQAKYRQSLDMEGATKLALEELDKIRKYRDPNHPNNEHWKNASRWILVANISINPNDHLKWDQKVTQEFQKENIIAEYWTIDIIERKLEEHPEIHDVFFEGENRVLVGLKESHDLLTASCIGNTSLEAPLIGRDDELLTILHFTDSNEKRILPIVGTGGIGKSRLLYEALVILSQKGWRVLWGLPESMSKSSKWFRLLNGKQKTCLALEDPSPSLLKSLIEQLSTLERKQWCIIVSFRSEKEKSLRFLRSNNFLHDALVLPPLDEEQSINLLTTYLQINLSKPWAYSVYKLTGGNPGWLCLVSELVKERKFPALPHTSDEIAELYIQSCLESFDCRTDTQTILRWLSLWGTFKWEEGCQNPPEVTYLIGKGIPKPEFHKILNQLVQRGIVRNWGIGKRYYAVEPRIIREYILSEWLFRKKDDSYEINRQGIELVTELVNAKIPTTDSILKTLSLLSIHRLDSKQTLLLLGPIFQQLEELAECENSLNQKRISDLVSKIGPADQERALDVLIKLRKHDNGIVEFELPIWGKQETSHEDVLSSLPWITFQLAEQVTDSKIGKRFLEEFKLYVDIEDKGEIQFNSGKQPRQLLKRLLSESSNSHKFSEPAYELIASDWESLDKSSSTVLFIDCLLDPVREICEWESGYTFSLSKGALLPGSTAWSIASKLRKMIYESLKEKEIIRQQSTLWKLLVKSHRNYLHVTQLISLPEEVVASYLEVLQRDISFCYEYLTLGQPPSLKESIYARDIWEFHLHDPHNRISWKTAKQCETTYNKLFPLRLQKFFESNSNNVEREAERIASIILSKSDTEELTRLFNSIDECYTAITKDSNTNRSSCIGAISSKCVNHFNIEENNPNAITSFVISVLSNNNINNYSAWHFSENICLFYIIQLKISKRDSAGSALKCILKYTYAKDRLLWHLYSQLSEFWIKSLTATELDCIKQQEHNFSHNEWFTLVGLFSAVSLEQCRGLVHRLEKLRDDTVEASKHFISFVHSLSFTLHCQSKDNTYNLANWILDQVMVYQLDANILNDYSFECLCRHADFRMNMIQLEKFIHSRFLIEKNKDYSRNIDLLPEEEFFSDLCQFNTSSSEDIEAFNKLCNKAISTSFLAYFEMPKIIAIFDPTGQHVSTYVINALSNNKNIDAINLSRLARLASGYSEESEPWRIIALPICQKASSVPRRERIRIYTELAIKNTSFYQSTPGEVPVYFIHQLEKAQSLLNNEPEDSILREYREWSLQCKEEELRLETERTEEDKNE